MAGRSPWSIVRTPVRGSFMQRQQQERMLRQSGQQAMQLQGLARSKFGWEKEKWQRSWDESIRAAEGMKGMVSEYNRAYGSARSANEARYQQLLSIADQTTGQRAADIRADYTGQQSTAMQRLARLGMANTTVAPTMRMGYQREQQSALNRLADQMQQTKMGVIERRVDQYPDPNILMGLTTAMGQGGPGARAARGLTGMRLG